MRDILLAEHRGQAGKAAEPQAVPIANFKEEPNMQSNPRVVTASQAFVVYALKSRSSLRVLPRAAKPDAGQLSYKMHTAPVSSAQFVNSRSNVVASASEKELLVWYVTDDGEIHTYFAFPKRVTAFSWLPVADSPPDLLVTVAEADGTKTTGVLKASSLIVRSTKSDAGVVAAPDGKLVADVATDFVPLRTGVSVEAPLTSAASPVFAYSTSNTSIATASLTNTTAPGWEPCDGKPVTALAMFPNELLVAVSSAAIHVWSVSGEPRPLQRIELGPRRVLALHATAMHAIAFLTTGQANACEAAVLRLDPAVGVAASAFYAVNSTITAIGSCSVPGKVDEPRVHLDTGKGLSVLNLVNAPWNPVDGAPAPVAAAPSPVAASPKGGKNKQPQQGATSGAPSPAASAAGSSSFARAGSNSFGAPSPAGPAAAGGDFDALHKHIGLAMGNTASMLSVVQGMVAKNSEKMVQEALKAQAKSLAAIAATQPVRGGGGGGGYDGASAFDAVLDDITDPVASALVEGITATMEEQLRTQLELSLKSVLRRAEQRKQKDSMADARDAIDSVVTDVMKTVSETLMEKQISYSSKLLHYVSDVAGEGNMAVKELQQVIVRQQEQLNAITESGLLEEVRRLREEVAVLKSRSGVAASAGAVDATGAPQQQQSNLPPETVLANARRQLSIEDYMGGLDWVLGFESSDMLVALLVDCEEDLRSKMIESKAIPASVWGRILGALAHTRSKEALEPALDWQCDIVAEKPELMKNDQLAIVVSTFIDSWKGQSGSLPSGPRSKLRQLAMLVRR